MNDYCTMCGGNKVAVVVGPEGPRESPCPACVMTPPGLRIVLGDNRTIPLASVNGKVTLRELTPEQLVETGRQSFIDLNSRAPAGFAMSAIIVLASELARTQKALAAVEARLLHGEAKRETGPAKLLPKPLRWSMRDSGYIQINEWDDLYQHEEDPDAREAFARRLEATASDMRQAIKEGRDSGK